MSKYTISKNTIQAMFYNGNPVKTLVYNNQTIFEFFALADTFLAGNFKMNLTDKEVETYFKTFDPNLNGKKIVVFPSLVSLQTALDNRKNKNILIGAQDVSNRLSGAYTGQISAKQLAALGVDYVLIGHSENAYYFDETYDIANEKLLNSLDNGLRAIVCINDNSQDENFQATLSEQIDAKLNGVSTGQMSNISIAYEPSFSIGTGRPFNEMQAQERCAFVRDQIGQLFDNQVKTQTKILFGGSIKLDNVMELISMSDIDGFFAGAISLRVNDMMQISSMI